jgi:hypothetical protein
VIRALTAAAIAVAGCTAENPDWTPPAPRDLLACDGADSCPARDLGWFIPSQPDLAWTWPGSDDGGCDDTTCEHPDATPPK